MIGSVLGSVPRKMKGFGCEPERGDIDSELDGIDWKPMGVFVPL